MVFCSRSHSLIVNIESEGPYAPEVLLPSAIRVLRSKLAALKIAAETLTSDEDKYAEQAGGDGTDSAMIDAQGDVVMDS